MERREKRGIKKWWVPHGFSLLILPPKMGRFGEEIANDIYYPPLLRAKLCVSHLFRALRPGEGADEAAVAVFVVKVAAIKVAAIKVAAGRVSRLCDISWGCYYGKQYMTENASLYWDQATLPARNRGIPWASLFGNHDDAPFEGSLDWFSSSKIPPLICTQPTSSYSGEGCSFKGTGRMELMKDEIKKNASFSVIGPRDLWPSVSNYVIQISS